MCCITQEASCLYWPEMEGDDLVAGKLLVTLLSEKIEKDFIEKKIEIKEEKIMSESSCEHSLPVIISSLRVPQDVGLW